MQIPLLKELISEANDPLIRALCDPARHEQDVESVKVIETHISWVLLTGSVVYKIKKPVRLPFVDFSTLEQRRIFCEEELRLNRRLAPELYLDVVPIGGSIEEPMIGVRPAIEYAVRLREFPSGTLLDERLDARKVPIGDVRELAEKMANFHDSLLLSRCFGNSVAITRAMLSNLMETEHVLRSSGYPEGFASLRNWMTQACVNLKHTFAKRNNQGSIRECHGDLHLENLVYWDNRIIPFDALEFDPRLRWIDVMDETAFLVMDLMVRDRPDLAYGYLDRYLEVTGDYTGLEVFKLYLVHRALVRAKVISIKGSQRGQSNERNVPNEIVDRYLRFAHKLTQATSPLLLITHGLSGSGKTTVTDQLIGRLPAIRCRSDLERKRLHGLPAHAISCSGIGVGLYSRDKSQATYAILRLCAAHALRAGINVMVDAAFLKRTERESFARLAVRERARFAILDCDAPESVLRHRINTRGEQSIGVSEATVEVLDYQLATDESFSSEELKFVVPVDTRRVVDYDTLEQRLRISRSPLPGRASLETGPPSSPSRVRGESRPFAHSPPSPSR